MTKTLTSLLLAGVSALPTAALSQTPPPESAATEPAATPPATNAAADIVVTGSRVIRNGNNSPTPVTVVNTEQLLTVQPSTVIDAVNAMPALQGSQSTASNPGGGQRNGAAAYLNLRNMGDLRTLVLMDGHRVVPTVNGMNANVDSWVVPQLLVQRVDVVTGGVSAVYGSDAVSGVVNFVTDKAFNGVKIQASNGISDYGDDHIYDIGAAFGTKLGDRGHIEFSAQYRKDPGIPNQLERPFFAQSLGGSGAGTAASPHFNVVDQRLSNTSFGGLIATPTNLPASVGTPIVLANQHFVAPGVLGTFNPGTATGTANVAAGGDGAWFRSASIKSALNMKQLFGRFDYDLTDNAQFYLQAAGTWNHTQNAFRAPNVVANIAITNPFLDGVPQITAFRAANPNGFITLRKFIDIPATANQWTRTSMFHGGLTGKLGEDVKWEVGAARSNSRLKAQNEVNVDNGRFFAAADAVRNASGQIVCRAAATNANYAGCVPLNLFGPGSESADALDYILTQTWNINRTTLTEVNGSVSGSPFDTWAGPVGVALSAEYRKIDWSVTSNAAPSDPIDCVGTRFGTLTGTPVAGNCNGPGVTIPTLRWLQTVSPGLSEVSQKVSEGAIEVDVPLAKDAAFARELNLNGALRYTHYSTSGNVTTWKLGLVWRVIDDLRLRATRSRDIRAPNVFELFSPTGVAPSNLTDPLTRNAAGQNVTGVVPVATVSNANLTPEIAKSWTGGFVWTPGFLPRFSFSVDGYWIKVRNAIVNVQGNSAQILNLCATSFSTIPECLEIIERPLPWTNTTAANFPTRVFQKWLNIAEFETKGVDFEASYSARPGGRPLDLRAFVSWQPKLIFDQGAFGVTDFSNAATAGTLFPASPAFKYTLLASFSPVEGFNIAWMQRGRGSMKAFVVPNGVAERVFRDGDRIPSTTFSNVTFTFDVKHRPFVGETAGTQFYFNIQNLFNKQPKVIYAGANANPGIGLFGFFPPNGDDIVGRYFTVGFRSRF